jgi:uridylate kinase
METKIISLGGSIVANEEINIQFLKGFKKIIEKFNYRFVIIVGGGLTARKYIQASKKFNVSSEDEDLIGISATRLNAELIRSIFNIKEKILLKPEIKKSKIIISGGYNPGNSTDYVATLFAEKFKSKEVINITNVGYVYDKDPKIKGAKKLKNLNWNEMQKIVGTKWVPGKNAPFDPIATKKAKELNLKVIILNGLNNLEKYLSKKEFEGTVIEK